MFMTVFPEITHIYTAGDNLIWIIPLLFFSSKGDCILSIELTDSTDCETLRNSWHTATHKKGTWAP